MAAQLGDKLGPRLSRLFVAHHLALRRQLAPVESRIAAAATQQLIDRGGREVADHYREMIEQLLAADADMPPWLRAYLERTASGEHQWHSFAGILGLTGITGGLSSIMTNALAPVVQQILQHGPAIHIDQNSAAAAAAARVIPYGDGVTLAGQAGFDAANFDALYQTNLQVPDAATLFDMANRGLISGGDLHHWLGRAGLPEQLLAPVAGLRRALLSPADAALAVLRGNMPAAEGHAVAAAAGLDAHEFGVLIGNTGEPPAIEEMLMLWRRGKIDTATLDRAILQSRVRDEWIPAIHELSTQPPTAADVLEALVQGELSDSEARRRYHEAGGDPTFFDTAFNTRANAPAPGQLTEMANRGIIPWDGAGHNVTSFHQGFVEGRWKNKWEPAFRRLGQYHPPPREVATLVKEGGMTQDQALHIWQQAGLTPEIAQMYWQAAHYTKTSKLHELAVGEIRQLYADRAITRAEALKMLESVRWTAIDANWLLDLTDMQLERHFLELAISKIHALFVSHKLNKAGVTAALAELSVTAKQSEQLLHTWELEAAANHKTLTVAEIVDAWFYEIIKAPAALTLLEQAGYSPRDAWIVLSIKNKGALKGVPEPA